MDAPGHGSEQTQALSKVHSELLETIEASGKIRKV